MRLFSRVLCVCSLLLLCSCSETKSEYNLGLKNSTSDNLRDVELSLIPKGLHPGFVDAPPGHSGWYMHIMHWPPPKTGKVSFTDPQNNDHSLEIKTGLSPNFRGDVLIIINEKNGEYYLTLKTGKLRELAFE